MGAIVASLVSPTVPSTDYGQIFKECLDALAFAVAQKMLEKATDGMVDWINSGFDGNPAFVQDYNKLLTDVADEEFGAFIESTPELSFMCSPFQIEIKKALIRANSRGSGGRFEREVTCRLSDVTSNVENFLNGDFTDGGWDAWRELAFDNPYSNYLEASIELQGRQVSALNEKLTQVEVGRGFLSFEKCTPAGEETLPVKGLPGGFGSQDQTVTFQNQDCTIETPGSVIEQQLNEVLPKGLNQLEVADELNEVVGALFAYLVNTAVTKGLSNMK